MSARMRALIALDDAPLDMRATVALTGATERCFALLAFPAQRNEDPRGALGVGGDGCSIAPRLV